MDRDHKTGITDLMAEYYEARDEDFDTKLTEFLTEEPLYTEDLIKGFLESYSFPDQFEWAEKEYYDRLVAYEDNLYDSRRDDDMELTYGEHKEAKENR